MEKKFRLLFFSHLAAMRLSGLRRINFKRRLKIKLASREEHFEEIEVEFFYFCRFRGDLRYERPFES